MRLIGRRILQAGESGDNAFHRGLVSDRPRDRSAASVRLSRPGRKSVVWRPETLTRVSCIFQYCTGIVRKQAITRAHTSMSAVGFSKNASRAHMHKHIRTCVAFSLTSRRSCVYTHTQVPAAKGGSGPQEIVFSIHKNLAKSGWYAKSTKKRHQHVRLVAARTKATAKSRTACIVV